MRQKVLLGLAVLMLLMTYSCRKGDIEQNENLERPNKNRLSTWDDTSDPPSPMEWIKDREGTGPYQPSDPNYFYAGDDPDVKNGNEYANYAHFYWNGVPEDDEFGFPLAVHTVLQIQWRFGAWGPWHNIKHKSNDYGLVRILAPGVLEDISAFAFPYSDGSAGVISIRMRSIRKDFITWTPDFAAADLYDRRFVSAWNNSLYGRDLIYENLWGFGRPQPEPTGTGGWTDSDPTNVIDGQMLVTVNLPVQTGYTFTYDISNVSGGYTESFTNKSPDFLGISKHKMMGIGFTGGVVSVVAKRKNNLTEEVTSTTHTINYILGTKTLNTSFLPTEF